MDSSRSVNNSIKEDDYELMKPSVFSNFLDSNNEKNEIKSKSNNSVLNLNNLNLLNDTPNNGTSQTPTNIGKQSSLLNTPFELKSNKSVTNLGKSSMFTNESNSNANANNILTPNRATSEDKIKLNKKTYTLKETHFKKDEILLTDGDVSNGNNVRSKNGGWVSIRIENKKQPKNLNMQIAMPIPPKLNEKIDKSEKSEKKAYKSIITVKKYH